MSITRESVKKGEHIYSCKCGWIDRAHASMDESLPESDIRLDVTEIWKQFPAEGRPGKRSPGRRGFVVTYIPAIGIVSSNLLPFNFPKVWFVKDMAGSLDAYRSIFLRLYQLGNERMEEIQALFDFIKHSSFSFEDLPSNTIAWYRGIFGMNYAAVNQACQTVSQADSEALADATNIDSVLIKNKIWTKALLFNDKCAACRAKGQVTSGFTDLPAEFLRVPPGNVTFTAPVGDAWPYGGFPGAIIPTPQLPFIPFIPIPPLVPGFGPIPFPPWDTPAGPTGVAQADVRTFEPFPRIDGLRGHGRTPGPEEG